MKKNLSFVVILMAFTCILWAGGKQEKGAEAVVLKMPFISIEAELDGWLAMIDAFNKEHVNIRIEGERVPGTWPDYNQRIAALFAAGTPPDLSRMTEHLMRQFISQGRFEDITSYVKNAVKEGIYSSGVFDQIKYDGKYYGIPMGILTEVTYYNKRLFDEAGIQYPPLDWDKPWNYEDTRIAAKKMTKGEGAGKQYGIAIRPDVQGLNAYMWGNGVNIFNDARTKCLLGSDAAKEVYKWLQDLTIVDKSCPAMASDKLFEQNEMFASGKVGILKMETGC